MYPKTDVLRNNEITRCYQATEDAQVLTSPLQEVKSGTTNCSYTKLKMLQLNHLSLQAGGS